MPDFIHNDPEFKELLNIVSSKKGIDISLIEKDYWIMHALYSLQQQGIEFELKGGTSLSKGYGLIHRFSEDIDIHIRTNFGLLIEGKDDKQKSKSQENYFMMFLLKQLRSMALSTLKETMHLMIKINTGAVGSDCTMIPTLLVLKI